MPETETKIPVKTCVLEAIREAVECIPELKTVRRFQGLPTDLSTIAHPSAFIYDSVAEQRSKANRVYQGDMDLQFDIYIELKSEDVSNNYLPFSDLADIIQARLHAVFFGPDQPNLKGLVLAASEVTVEKAIANDLYGVLSYIITITYRHQIGDAFSLDRLP